MVGSEEDDMIEHITGKRTRCPVCGGDPVREDIISVNGKDLKRRRFVLFQRVPRSAKFMPVSEMTVMYYCADGHSWRVNVTKPANTTI